MVAERMVRVLWLGLWCCLVVTVLPACAGPDSAEGGAAAVERAAETTPADAGERVPGEYIVAVKAGGIEEIASVFADHGPTVLRDLGRGRYLIHLADDPGPEAVADLAAAAASIRHAEPNRVYRLPTPPGGGKRLGDDR